MPAGRERPPGVSRRRTGRGSKVIRRSGATFLTLAAVLNLIPAALTAFYLAGWAAADPSTEPALASLLAAMTWWQMALWVGACVLYLRAAWRLLKGRPSLAVALAGLGADLTNYALVWRTGVYGEFRGQSGLAQDALVYLFVLLGLVCAAAAGLGRGRNSDVLSRDPA